MLKLLRLSAGLVCALLPLVVTAAADELYEFDFSPGRFSISMPTSVAPEVTKYTDTDGGEFSWLIDDGGVVGYLFGMTHTTSDVEWTYSFEHCDQIKSDPDRTLRVNKEYWKYCVSDVVLNKDDLELTYVDIWKTRKGFKYDLRFICARTEDHEALMELIKDHMKTLEWWN